MSRIKWRWIGVVALLACGTVYGQPAGDVFPDAKKVYEIKEFTKGERVAVGSAGNVLRWAVTNDKDQQFRFVDRGGGKWAIQSLRENKFLRVGGLGRLAVADEKKEAAQEFRVEKSDGKKFRLRESTKDEYVAVGSNGAVLRWAKSGKDDQLFEWIEKPPPAAPSAVVFPDAKKVYEIKEFTRDERVAVGTVGEVLRWKVTGGNDQKFRFIDKRNGQWAIQSLRNSKLLSMDADIKRGYGQIITETENKPVGLADRLLITPSVQTFKIEKLDGQKFQLVDTAQNWYVSVGETGRLFAGKKTGAKEQTFEWVETTEKK